MKILYLLRHAKSSWEISPDFDRPLTERGYADSHLVGKYLIQKKIHVDLVISSPAIRAITTALIISKYLDYSPDSILMREQLYDSSVKDYLNCIADISKGNSIVLAGHNNTISQVAEKLSVQPVNDLKTCSIVAIQFNIDTWKDIADSKGDLLFELHPSAIKSM